MDLESKRVFLEVAIITKGCHFFQMSHESTEIAPTWLFIITGQILELESEKDLVTGQK